MVDALLSTKTDTEQHVLIKKVILDEKKCSNKARVHDNLFKFVPLLSQK